MFGFVTRGSLAIDRISRHEKECEERYKELIKTIQDLHAQRVVAVEERHKENQARIGAVQQSVRWIFLQLWAGLLFLVAFLLGLSGYLFVHIMHW